MKSRLISIGLLVAVLCIAIAALETTSLRRDDKPAREKIAQLDAKLGEAQSLEPIAATEESKLNRGSASNTDANIHDRTASPDNSFTRLLIAAEGGDAVASLSLARTIWQCLHVPISRDAYDRSLIDLGSQSQPSQANYNAEIQQIDECAETPRNKELAVRHYKIAADHGDLDAAYEYATILPSLSGLGDSEVSMVMTPEIEERFRKLDTESVDYLLKAAERGHIRSAVALAGKYQYGFEIYPHGTRRSLRDPDLLRAYAWFYAAETAGAPRRRTWRNSIEPKLAEQSLLAEAQALGQEFYREYLQ